MLEITPERRGCGRGPPQRVRRRARLRLGPFQRKFLEEFGRLSVEDFAGRLDPFEVPSASMHGPAQRPMCMAKQPWGAILCNRECPVSPEQLHDLFGRGRIWEGPHFWAPFGGCRVYMMRGKASPVSTRYGKDLSSLSKELNLGRCSRIS